MLKEPWPNLSKGSEEKPQRNWSQDTLLADVHPKPAQYKTCVLNSISNDRLVVLYVCETWSLTLREERRLKVLRRIFGPRRDEVTGEWRKLHNEELTDLYSSSNIVRVIKSRRMRWAGHVACIGERRSVYRVSVGKPEGNGPLGRHRLGWEDNIKMDFQKVGCGDMDWIEMAQDRDR